MTLDKRAWPWAIAGISFVALLGAAAFRSTPGALVDPLKQEFGWSNGTMGLAMSVNMRCTGSRHRSPRR